MSAVYAKESAALHFAGGVVPVKAGQKFDSADAIVREHPSAFEFPEGDEPGRRRRRVERATANPGEYRDLS